MEVVPTLIIKTLNNNTGVDDVKNSLKGSSTLNFSITVAPPGENEYDVVYNFLTSVYSLNKYVFIIHDTSITTADSKDIAEYFSTLIRLNSEGYSYDICFLGRFLDSCNQYSDIKTLTNSESDETGTYVARTTGSKGIEAILFSPSGTKKFLSDVTKYPSLNETLYYAVHGIENEDGVLRGISFNPQLYSFSPQYVTSMNDYVRTAQCSNVKAAANPTPTTGKVLQFFIFIIVIILILVGVYFLFKITPQPEY